MLTVHTSFDIGDTVYLRIGEEGLRGIITSIRICGDGLAMYGVSWGDRRDHDHYAIELSREPVYSTAGD